jgi:hypothetical protein
MIIITISRQEKNSAKYTDIYNLDTEDDVSLNAALQESSCLNCIAFGPLHHNVMGQQNKDVQPMREA